MRRVLNALRVEVGLMLSLQMRHDAESFATVFDPTQH